MSAQLHHNAVGLGGPKEPCITWGPDHQCEGAICSRKDVPGEPGMLKDTLQ